MFLTFEIHGSILDHICALFYLLAQPFCGLAKIIHHSGIVISPNQYSREPGDSENC